MSAQQGPELHLNVPAQQEPLLLLRVSILKWPELHLDVFRLQEPLMLLDMSLLQTSAASVHVSKTGPELLLDISGH
jgi:hypothetical protein